MSKIILSKVNSQYGAPLGRQSDLLIEGDKLRLQRMQLVDGDYDTGGAYWGAGVPMWVAEDTEGNRVYFRACNRTHAKQTIRNDYCPEARFYR